MSASAVAAPLLMPSSYAPNAGGVEEVTRQLAHGLADRGLRPSVLTNRWPKALPRQEVLESVPVRRDVFRVPEPTARQYGGWLLFGELTHREHRRYYRRAGTDLVNLHCVSSNARYALRLSRSLQAPLVVSIHGELSGDAGGAFQRSSQHRRSWRRVLDAAARITAPSRYTLQQAEDVYGSAFGERGVVIPNGVDLDLFRPAVERDLVISAIGRLVAPKDFQLVVRAFASISDEIPHRLVIAGDGPARSALVALADQLGVAGRVDFLGEVDRSGVARLVTRSDLLVLASREEALGLVLLEAAASGVPVVATRAGGIPEVVEDGRTGLLVEVGDVHAFASAMAALLFDRTRHDAFGRAALVAARGRSWAHCVSAYRDVFDATVAR